MIMIKHGTWSAYTKHNCRCEVCRKLSRDYQRKRRLNKDVNDKDKANSKAYFKRMQKYIYSQKDKPCVDCYIKYPPYVMHFDHLGNEPKLFRISEVKSKAKIDAEIKKCEVVCANCHAIRSWKRLNNLTV